MKRTCILGPFTAAAFFLALASVALACTTYKGDMTVTGNPVGTGTGNGTGMGYCEGIAPSQAGVTGGTEFTVDIAPSSNANCNYQFEDMTAHVNYQKGTLSTTDCMSSLRDIGGEVQIGTMDIANGYGTGKYTIPSSAGTGDVQICVSESNAGTGMQIPATLS